MRAFYNINCLKNHLPSNVGQEVLFFKKDSNTTFINGHTRFGKIDHTLGLFNKMNVDGYAPDEITYNALIKDLCKVGRLFEALSA